MADAVGKEVAETLQSMSLEVYRIAAEHAAARGLILADTKFEWGFDADDRRALLVDEVLTPDSSRYWSKSIVSPGRAATVVRQAVRSRLARDERTGTRRARRRRCPRTSSRKRAASTSRLIERLTGGAFLGSSRARCGISQLTAEHMLRYLTAGESHGPALTAIVEGFPSGVTLDTTLIDRELERRQGGYGRGKRQQIETDRIIVESGVFHGVTTGSPITLRLINNDAKLERLTEPAAPRGGHIDLAGAINYQTGIRQVLERASARETALRVAAGAVAKLLLRELGITVFGYVRELGGIAADAAVVRPCDSRRKPGLHA